MQTFHWYTKKLHLLHRIWWLWGQAYTSRQSVQHCTAISTTVARSYCILSRRPMIIFAIGS